MKKYYFIFYLTSIFLDSDLLLSHDLWFESVSQYWILKYGHIENHKNQEHQESLKEIPYKKEQILRLSCVHKSQKSIEEINNFSAPVKLSYCPVFWVEFTSFYWHQTVEGLKQSERISIQKQDVLDSWESIETLKQIQEWNDHLSNPLSESLEIIPLENPFRKKLGEKIQIKIVYKKNPAKNIPVSYYDDVRGNTDEEGIIRVRLRKAGLQVIKATLTDFGYNPKRIITASLVFQLHN
ncbi:MAG: DUF4198 domain-containing protein [Leptospiraceae bacterium]|nr:DUF4198 domain-containing protein [Leptospiraceae bacterium]MDW7976000.1 DUF4198 domain-containing protein [Leptospiraceae bacterium]